MTSSISRLRHHLAAFDAWVPTADRRNDGWQSDYPGFGELVDAAAAAMRALASDPAGLAAATAADLGLIARVWSLSEEAESMPYEIRQLDAAERAALGPLIVRLYEIGDHDTRWQIASIAGHIPTLGPTFLRRAVEDPDAYVRQRAWNAWADCDRVGAATAAVELAARESDTEVARAMRAARDAGRCV